MTHIPPTILDISRSVMRLHENAEIAAPTAAFKINGEHWTVYELRHSVARNIAFSLRNWPGYARSRVTTRDVACVMATHGASAATIDHHARAIAHMIKADLEFPRS